MKEKESNTLVTGFKVVLVIMLAVALWPVLEVLMGCLVGVVTFGFGVLCMIAVLMGITYLCGFAFNSAKKGVPDNVEKRVRGKYDKTKEYLKNKLKNEED